MLIGNVRFTPKSGHPQRRHRCLLSARNRHQAQRAEPLSARRRHESVVWSSDLTPQAASRLAGRHCLENALEHAADGGVSGSTRTRAMPLTRMKDDYTISDGVKFW